MPLRVRVNEDGEVLTYPLDIHMYEAHSITVLKKARNSMNDLFEHLILKNYIEENADEYDEGAKKNLIENHERAASELTDILICLVTIADNEGIDIISEIYDVPWEV